jgi:hypothetical protein
MSLLMGLGLALGVGCAGMIETRQTFDYFGQPAPTDAWSPKIAGWQRRERVDDGRQLGRIGGSPSVEADAGDAKRSMVARERADDADGLRDKYFSFRAERRRDLARDVTSWIQSQAKDHYVADGPIDHWATLEETLRGNGDDCDGLELLVYHALRDLGFGDSEVYRAVVYRPSDGQHHMVTLWFEDRNDPWVIDPTGAMTRNMLRMSQMPQWVPIKVFSETAEYTVEREVQSLNQGTLAVNAAP